MNRDRDASVKEYDALYYYNDINIRLLTYLTIIYNSKRHKYNLDLFVISFNEYYKVKTNDNDIKRDLHVLINYYIDDGHSLLINDNVLVINDLVDIKILLDKVITSSSDKIKKKLPKNGKNEQKSIAADYCQMMNLLSASSETSSNRDSNKVNYLLSKSTSFYKLYRERLQHSSRKHKFHPVCADDQKSKHSLKILKFYNISLKKHVDWSKFKSQLTSEEITCFSTKTHFLPILIKYVTDIQLGDCSYLDTCHKFQQNNNNCKYVHYYEYNPNDNSIITEDPKTSSFVEFTETLDEIDPLFTFNVSNYRKTASRPKPVKCDIRKYDFKDLQKENFNAIIADPPWNIHMNLPYGTCNDQELFDLPLYKLQAPKINHHYNVFKSFNDSSNRFVYKKGGVMALWVTVRSINLGKQLMLANGYKIMNELSWIKINQLCRTIVTGRTGHWLNHSKEHLLIGYKGNVDEWLLLRQQDLDYIVSQTRETSRKPDELYDILERLCGEHSNNLELFGRNNNLRPGWVTLGNQL
ncbi:hypothetical protein QEN19_002108 [Hanseniaspora menglaensis]